MRVTRLSSVPWILAWSTLVEPMLTANKMATELSAIAAMDTKETHLFRKTTYFLKTFLSKQITNIVFRCELNPCFNDPCGANADCDSRGRSAVCTCRQGMSCQLSLTSFQLTSWHFPGYVGDPFTGCQLEPCSTGPCGTNAECTSSGRSAICTCPRSYTGDPYVNCVRDPCSTDPCGKLESSGI